VDAHSAGRTSRGSGPPEALWRNRARCVLVGGRACPQGHRVALFASAESETAAELIVCAPQSLRLAGYRDHLGNTLAMLREVRRRADDFDIIHFHVDLLPQALFHDIAHKCLVTLHGRLDLPDAWPLYKAYRRCRWSQFQMRSAVPCHIMQIGLRRSHTACRRASVRSAGMAAAIWLSSVASRRKSARTAR